MKKIVIAVALAASSSMALANGVYVGGSVGHTHADLDCAGTSSCSNNGTGFKGFVGYQFNDTFSAEFSYFDLGKPNATVDGANLDLKNTGFGVRGLASYPITKDASAFFALGLNRVKSEATVSFNGMSGSASETSTQPSAAIGVDYALTQSIKLRGEFESTRFNDIAGGSYTVHNFSIGLKASF